MEVKQTARPLEINAHANFSMVENVAYQCMENGEGETCLHWQVYGSLCVSCTMLRQSQVYRRVPREHAECFLSIVRHTDAEQRYHQWGQLTHFYHTNVRRGPPSLFRQLDVVRFPCGREKNMGTYGYTKWTCSQRLTVLGHNYFWSTSQKVPFFYTCNTVVLYTGLN